MTECDTDKNSSNPERDELTERLANQGRRNQPIEFQLLSNGGNDVYIQLDGEVYRLLRTKNHKLILTK